MDSEAQEAPEAPIAEAEAAAAPLSEAWPFFGYAPGGYHCRCADCDEAFEGAKRSIKCLECAVIASKRDAGHLAQRVEELSKAPAIAESAPEDEAAKPELKAFAVILDNGQRVFRGSRMTREDDWIIIWNGARQIAQFFRPIGAGEQS